MRQSLFLLLALSLGLVTTSFILKPAEEFGKAGYYADALQGRKTASGEKYDKNILTCAHKTYPFGTKLRVTRLDNKKAVIVRVNDRGPYSEGFVIDISRAAAEEIDLVKAGRATVKVEVVEEPATSNTSNRIVTAAASTEREAEVSAAATKAAAKSKTQLLKSRESAEPAARPATHSTADPAPTTTQKAKSGAVRNSDLYRMELQKSVKAGFGIQVSTMYDADNVIPMVTKLQTQFPGKVLVSMERDETNNQSTYRIVIGPYPTRQAAEAQQKVAERKGNKKCFVVDLSTI